MGNRERQTEKNGGEEYTYKCRKEGGRERGERGRNIGQSHKGAKVKKM